MLFILFALAYCQVTFGDCASRINYWRTKASKIEECFDCNNCAMSQADDESNHGFNSTFGLFFFLIFS